MVTSAESTRVGAGPASAPSLERVPVLDGIRGLAILLVMIHHFTFLPKAGVADTLVYAVSKLGWTGVDLFFVLSGYLITSVLVRHRDDRNYYSVFYARRVLRLLPVYYVVLAVTLFVLPALVDLGRLEGSSLWFWLHLSNISIALHGLSHKSLDIAWSLSIEEQFYLFWPLLVRWTPRRWLLALCLTVFASSVLVRLGLELAGADWLTSYVLAPARMDGLALGGALAAMGPSTLAASRARAWKVVVAAGAVTCAVLIATRSTKMAGPFGPTIGFAALAVLWAAFITAALTTPPLNRALCSPTLTALGKYSYALYLLHMPVAYIVRDHIFMPSRWPLVGGSYIAAQVGFHLMAGTISFALARLSWSVLEEPFLRLKRYFRYGAPEGLRAADTSTNASTVTAEAVPAAVLDMPDRMLGDARPRGDEI